MVKILAIGDPHGKLPRNLDKIVRRNKIEVIVCVGDVPPVPKNLVPGNFPQNFRKKSDKSFKSIVKKLCSYKLPVLILRGNMYRRKETAKLTFGVFKKYKNLFYKRIGRLGIKGQGFVFLDMIWESHSFRTKWGKGHMRYNKNMEKKLNKFLRGLENPVLISHTPPYGSLDKIKNGKHIGSKILLEAIKKHQPKLVLCGHIHGAKGKAKIGKTRVINLGCCGDYEIIDVK